MSIDSSLGKQFPQKAVSLVSPLFSQKATCAMQCPEKTKVEPHEFTIACPSRVTLMINELQCKWKPVMLTIKEDLKRVDVRETTLKRVLCSFRCVGWSQWVDATLSSEPTFNENKS